MPYRRRKTAFSHWHKKASKIQRAYRSYRKRKPKRTVHNQKYNSVQNKYVSKTVKGTKNPKSLSNRLKALEVSAKKHHDTLQFRPVQILSWGCATNIAGQYMDDFLKVPTKNVAGEIQNGSSVAEDQVRDGDEIYLKSALIQFQLNTYTPTPGLSDSDYNLYLGLNQPFFHTRVVFTILQDMRPSQNDGQSTSQPNALPQVPGERPLESIYRRSGDFDQADNSTMITCDSTAPTPMGDSNYGADNALLSYDSSRFKKVHQESIVLNAITPSKLIKHRLVINRRAKYMVAPQQSGDPLLPSSPINFNYLLMLSTTASIDPTCNLDTPETLLALLRPPTVSKGSCRLYFTDA